MNTLPFVNIGREPGMGLKMKLELWDHNQEFYFGHTDLEISVRYPSGDVKCAVGYVTFGGRGRDLNWQY